MSCGLSASSIARKKEKQRQRERELRAKLIAFIQQTSELENKLRTIERAHEMEQLRMSLQLKEEEAELEKQKAAIALQTELKLLQEEEPHVEAKGDPFYDHEQEHVSSIQHTQESQRASKDPPHKQAEQHHTRTEQSQPDESGQKPFTPTKNEIPQQPRQIRVRKMKFQYGNRRLR